MSDLGQESSNEPHRFLNCELEIVVKNIEDRKLTLNGDQLTLNDMELMSEINKESDFHYEYAQINFHFDSQGKVYHSKTVTHNSNREMQLISDFTIDLQLIQSFYKRNSIYFLVKKLQSAEEIVIVDINENLLNISFYIEIYYEKFNFICQLNGNLSTFHIGMMQDVSQNVNFESKSIIGSFQLNNF